METKHRWEDELTKLNIVIKEIFAAVERFRNLECDKIKYKNPEQLSFLEYESFEQAEFPSLFRSCQVDLQLQKTSSQTALSNNPPVLHRKELLVHPNHPDAKNSRDLTAQLENMGAFKNIVKLGTKLRWQDELVGCR